MGSEPRRVVVVGGGLAGASCIGALVEGGWGGAVTLLAEEPELPYNRPPLSKKFLDGATEIEDMLVHPESFYEEHDVDVRLGTPATAVDTAARTVTLANGDAISYDELVLATGAAPRPIPVPGADLAQVRMLRTVADARILRDSIAGASRVAVVGAGWIGTEIAAWSRKAGAEATLIDPLAAPLARVVGAEAGQAIAGLHEAAGVDLRMGTGVTGFEEIPGGVRVSCDSGDAIEADIAVVAIGVAPRTGLAEAAGLAVTDGVHADARLHTDAPGVWVAGDIARHEHPDFGPIRVEHWSVARNHGTAVARAILNPDEPAFDEIPHFMSRQHEVLIQYWGHAKEWDDVVLRPGEVPGTLTAVYLAGDRMMAGMSVGIEDIGDAMKTLISMGSDAPLDRLRDPARDLTMLASATSSR